MKSTRPRTRALVPGAALSIGLLLSLPGCTNYQAQAGLIGGLAGAGLGAALGDDHQDVVAGAAAGTALGVAGASIHENRVRNRNYERYGIPPEPRPYGQPPPETTPAPPPPSRGTDPGNPSYPVAQLTETPGQVLSPYPPHHRIDVSGFRPGQLAKDPKTGEIFEVP